MISLRNQQMTDQDVQKLVEELKKTNVCT